MCVLQASVCNRARFEQSEESTDDRKVLGDATDCGLLRYVDKLTNYPLLREKVLT